MPLPNPGLILELMLLLLLVALPAAQAAPPPGLDLKLDRSEALEFWIPPGQSAPDVLGVRLFAIPAGAGGGR